MMREVAARGQAYGEYRGPRQARHHRLRRPDARAQLRHLRGLHPDRAAGAVGGPAEYLKGEPRPDLKGSEVTIDSRLALIYAAV